MMKIIDSSQITDKKIYMNISQDLLNKADYIFFSGGTTSRPKVIPFYKNEWDKKSKYRSNCYKFAGLVPGDKVAIMLPFGPWIAGPSAQSALEMLSCKIFPLGMVDTEDELKALITLLITNNISNLVTTPSFLNFILSTIDKYNIKIEFKKIFTSGEVAGELLRKKALKITGGEVYSCYASSETFIGIECSAHNGYHYDPKKIKLELFDDGNTNNNILVSAKDAILIPLSRYKIGDLGIIEKKCLCGSGWPIVKLVGRSENGFLINGAVNVFPYQIKDALVSVGINFISCFVTIDKIENDLDLVSFEIYVEDDEILEKSMIIDSLQKMSLDFSDVIHHGIVKIDLKILKGKRLLDQQKIKIVIEDKRIYE